jgi:hypothetical protein
MDSDSAARLFFAMSCQLRVMFGRSICRLDSELNTEVFQVSTALIGPARDGSLPEAYLLSITAASGNPVYDLPYLLPHKAWQITLISTEGFFSIGLEELPFRYHCFDKESLLILDYLRRSASHGLS